MESLKRDDRAQWIVLSGLVISFILVAVAILANQAVINGYYSSNAVLELPKEEIRELSLQTRENSRIILDMSYELNQTSNMSVHSIFYDIFTDCDLQIKSLYATHGQTVDTKLIQIDSISDEANLSQTDIIWVRIDYNDGRTRYISNPEVIEVNR